MLFRLPLEIVRSRFTNIGDDMVHDGAIGRRGLHILNPRVLGKPSGQNHVLVFQDPGGWNRKRPRQLEDLVWLGNGPAGDEVERRRQIFGVALGRTRVRPGGNGIDLRLGQRAVILKLLGVPILKPWRHGPGDHHLLYRQRPGARIFIGHHREGRAFSRAMTALAVLLHNGCNILGEGHIRWMGDGNFRSRVWRVARHAGHLPQQACRGRKLQCSYCQCPLHPHSTRLIN